MIRRESRSSMELKIEKMCEEYDEKIFFLNLKRKNIYESKKH